jgi:hypothetical protein
MIRATREYDPFVTPDMICGGVWVDAQECFVPVTPTGEIKASDGTSLWEYKQDMEGGKGTGPSRACLLETRNDSVSPVWLLTDAAAQDGYYERHAAVDGDGRLVIRSVRMTARSVLLACNFWGWPMKPFELTAGQSFQVQARGVGARVLATFPGAAFQECYEERIED